MAVLTPRRVDEPLAPHLLPEFRRPAPCDRVFVPAPRAITPGGPRVVVGPTARAAFATYSDLGRRYRLEGFSKSPHSVVRGLYRQSLMRLTAARLTGTMDLTWPDDTNVSRTLRLWKTDGNSNAVCFNQDAGVASNQTRLKYGTGTTAPTSSDVNIQTQVGNTLDASVVSYDDTNKQATVSGSEVFPGSASFVQEIAQFGQYQFLSGGVKAGLRNFLLDHTLLSSQVLILTGQTAAVSYLWQF